MSDDDHVKFAACVHGLKGMVMVSGYHSPLYDSLFAAWRRVERDSLADGARARKEVLWFNFSPHVDLFTHS